jgi:hypothetical protein
MKVITNKDGTMETVNDLPGIVTPQKVAQTRKELRDMLSGNTSFHEDDFVDPPSDDDENVTYTPWYLFAGVAP